MRWIPLTAILLLLASCQADPRQRIVGHWTLDPSRTVIPKTPIPGLEKKARSLLGNVSAKFSADGTAVLSGPTAIDGKWSLSDDKVTLQPADSNLMKKFPLGGESIAFTIDPEFQHLTWQLDTPFGKATLVLIKTG